MVRTIFLGIAQNLKAEGKLKSEKDVFYLTVDEVTSLVNNSLPDATNLIDDRKEQYAYFDTLPQYRKLVFSGQVANKQPLRAKRTIVDDVENKCQKRFIGTSCSPGIANEEVVVVTNPKESIDTIGKILIAKSADPGWIFLLANAKGVIIEQGSLLSHTAIISRELKIPSIVGVSNITKLIKTGDRVHMNGSTGELEVERA